MNTTFRRILSLVLALTMIGSPLAVCAEGLTDEATEPETAVVEETTEESTQPEETEVPTEPETVPEETEETVPEETEESEDLPEEPVEETEVPEEEDQEEALGATVASGICGTNLKWSLDTDGILTISGTGPMYHYSYGSTPWYTLSNTIKTIIIGDGVTSIGVDAFANCSSLTSVTIGDGVTILEAYTFYNCSSLTSVTIGSSVTIIGDYAFSYCSSLKSITIPDSVTSIGGCAFEYCRSLTSVTIGRSVTRIKDYAISWCSNLKDIYFRGDLPDILRTNFYDVTATAYYPTGNTTYANAGNYGGNLTWKPYDPEHTEKVLHSGKCGENLTWKITDDGQLIIEGNGEMDDFQDNESPWKPWYQDIKQIEVNNGVTSLGAHSLGSLLNVTEIVISNTVKEIREGAFAYSGTSYGMSIIFQGNAPEITDENTFGTFGTIDVYYNPASSGWNALMSREFNNPTISWIPTPKNQCVSVKELWAFNNTADYFGGKGNGYYITKSDYQRLIGQLTLPEKIAVKGGLFSNYYNVDGKTPIHYQWGGSCYGMAAVAAIIRNGIFRLAEISSEKCVNDIDKGKKPISHGIMSLLHFYLFQQCISAIDQKQKNFMLMNQKEQVSEMERIVKEAEKNGKFAMISFAYATTEKKDAHHTVVGYAVETGNFNVMIRDKHYHFGHRILTYDPMDLGNEQNINSGIIYYNDDQLAMVGPVYNGISKNNNLDVRSTDNTFQLKMVTSDEKILNAVDYRTGVANFRNKSRAASETTVLYYTQNEFQYTTGKSINSIQNGLFDGRYTISGDGAVILGRITGENPDNDRVIVLPENSSVCRVESTEGGYFSMYSDSCFLSAASSEETEYSFSTDGRVALSSNTPGKMEIAITADERSQEQKWETVGISAKGTTGIGAERTKAGIVITGTNLGDVAVTGYMDEESDTVFFHSTEDTVIISEENGEFTVSEDKDGDGVFETEIPVYTESEQPVSISLEQTYLALIAGESVRLNCTSEVQPITWTAENAEPGEAVISVDANGTVRALRPGTAYAVASVTVGEETYSARCRIDVVDNESLKPILYEVSVNGVDLIDSKAVVELFRTDYAQVGVLLNLTQNMSISSVDAAPADQGAAIERAKFSDDALNVLFRLRVRDDRTLEIIPTEAAVSNPASVKASYKSAVKITVEGREFETAPLTLTVKKSLPTIKAAAVKINSFDGTSAAMTFTGGKVTALRPDGALPAGFRLDGMKVVYTGSQTKASAKLNLLAAVEGYAVEKAVTVPVSVTRTEPTVKLKPASVTLLAKTADAAQTVVTVEEGRELELTLLDSTGKVTDALNYAYRNGIITVSPKANTPAGTYKLAVNVVGSSKKANLTIKAADRKAALSLKASGTIDTAIPDSPITITAKISGFHVGSGESYHVTIMNGTKDATDLFRMYAVSNVLTLTAAGGIPKGTYTAKIGADLNNDGTVDCEKSVKLNIKWSDPAKVKPSVTLKASGSIDPVKPGSTVTVKPTFKNLFGHSLSASDLVFFRNGVKLESAPFHVTVKNGAYVITGSGADSSAKYTAAFSANSSLPESKQVPISVKSGTVKLVQSLKAVTLLKKDRFDSVVIHLDVPAGYNAIGKVEQDGTSAALYTVTDLGGGDYAISFAGHRPAAKAATVKLKVYLKGNLNDGAKPNATVSIKVSPQ